MYENKRGKFKSPLKVGKNFESLVLSCTKALILTMKSTEGCSGGVTGNINNGSTTPRIKGSSVANR